MIVVCLVRSVAAPCSFVVVARVTIALLPMGTVTTASARIRFPPGMSAGWTDCQATLPIRCWVLAEYRPVLLPEFFPLFFEIPFFPLYPLSSFFSFQVFLILHFRIRRERGKRVYRRCSIRRSSIREDPSFAVFILAEFCPCFPLNPFFFGFLSDSIFFFFPLSLHFFSDPVFFFLPFLSFRSRFLRLAIETRPRRPLRVVFY